MAPMPGKMRYNTDVLGFERSTDGAETFSELIFHIGNRNFGIGTSNPLTRLHIIADSANLSAIRLQNIAPSGATWQITSADNGELRFTELGVATRVIIQNGTGNVGIGTTPTQKLQVAGGMTHLLPSSASPNQGLQMDTVGLPNGSNGIYFNHPTGWSGNSIKANLGGIESWAIRGGGTAWFAGYVSCGTSVQQDPLLVKMGPNMNLAHFISGNLPTLGAHNDAWNQWVDFKLGPNVFMRGDGLVGIGIHSTNALLHVYGKTKVGANSHVDAEGAISVDGAIRLVWGTNVPTPGLATSLIWLESNDNSLRIKMSNGVTPFILRSDFSTTLNLDSSYVYGGCIAIRKSGGGGGRIGPAWSIDQGLGDANDFAVRADGGKLFLETSGQGIYSQRINADTTSGAANIYIDPADGRIRRSTSSLRYKIDIKNLPEWRWLLNLSPISFKDRNNPTVRYGGFSAEDISIYSPKDENGIPLFAGIDKNGLPDDVKYSNMVAPIISAIKELHARVLKLEGVN